MMTIDQCRGARALLDWSAQKLADEANVGVATVRRFESGQTIADHTLASMLSALEAAGVIFIADGEMSDAGGRGVRLVSARGE